ncbi:TetR/AcrR family transcriptional regulator [Rhodococcus sp. 14-2483-1-2]|uniref:TetR/AcrR family transcriptional regulator n=1 Tax=Rhodococcus sp. 14-2483-1-2 TaxID=2023147 RepID=UPI000B9A64BD|nr:TetR/AcrR family transcriptional regulator [Rhodococcus sp. 14-2483-1-2]OZF37491.1 TetR family transcriptional regulator [Rhodococcus sp. 14-2483-1-2]
MPRNRRPVDRAEKRSEIVNAARSLFVDDGYEHTPMGRIATAAGVTTNTIYWYFGDKDELLVGVLDDIHTEALGRFGALATQSVNEQVLWVVDELEKYHRLVDTVHSRTSVAACIDKWHNDFHALWEQWIAVELRNAGVDDAGIEPTTRMIVFVIEAMLTHPQDEASKRAMIDLLFRKVGVRR